MKGFRVKEDRRLDTRWMDDALCAERSRLPWTDDHTVRKVLINTMREVCAACPVRAQCAAYAVEAKITAGWWAGRNLNRFTHAHPPTAEDMRGDAA